MEETQEQKEAREALEAEQENKEESKEEKQEDKQEEQKAEDKPQESPSLHKSATDEKIKHLTDLVTLHGEKMETIFQHQRETHDLTKESNQMLKETVDLLQGVIGATDEHHTQLAKVTASLIELHRRQSNKSQS